MLPNSTHMQEAVFALLGSGRSNPLQSALDAKVNVAEQFTEADATRVVNNMVVGPPGPNNALRNKLDTVDGRLEALEAVVSCGFSP